MSELEPLQPLVQLEQHNIALLFANYLLTINIAAKVVTDTADEVANIKQKHTVYCQHDKLEQATIEFEHFIKNPFDAKYQQAAWQHGETVTLSDQNDTFLKSFKDNFLAHGGIVTLVVFALCWLVYIGSSLGGARLLFTNLQFYSSLSVEGLISEPWRIISPAFLHFSIIHIVFNTMWWWQLGGSIENILSKSTLIQLSLIAAIVSNVGQFLVSGANFGGLSGVVYALVGFVWWYGYFLPEKGLFLSKSIIGFLLIWLVLGFADLLPVNVANTAHLLGLVSGCLFAVFIVNNEKSSTQG